METGKIEDTDRDFLKKLVVGIGEVSEITGIPQRQIRYWESKGYVRSLESATSTRRYDYPTIKKMLLIKELLDEGYTLESSVEKVEKRLEMIERTFNRIQRPAKGDK
jgi:DNA-binding transcriptional MerR regulator